jgi:ABC-type nitrate/sulfonate/bicarbonate transport system permease component
LLFLVRFFAIVAEVLLFILLFGIGLFIFFLFFKVFIIVVISFFFPVIFTFLLDDASLPHDLLEMVEVLEIIRRNLLYAESILQQVLLGLFELHDGDFLLAFFYAFLPE